MRRVWDKYYASEKIITKKFCDITVPELKEFYLDMIEAHSLTNKQFKEMKSVLNMMYDYAIELNLCRTNTSHAVRNISWKKFATQEKKIPQKQIFSNEEETKLIELALEQFEKLDNPAYLAVIMNFTLALRVGEPVALKQSDFSQNTVHIQRQEVKVYEKLPNGKYQRTGYEIVDHLKSQDSDRKLQLTKATKMIFNKVVAFNTRHGYESEYLFLTPTGERMNNDAVNNVLRQLNRKLNISQKANHSIRKTFVSNLGGSHKLCDEEIRTFAGHKEFSTTAKYYMYQTESSDKHASVYENTIGCTVLNVFRDVQD